MPLCSPTTATCHPPHQHHHLHHHHHHLFLLFPLWPVQQRFPDICVCVLWDCFVNTCTCNFFLRFNLHVRPGQINEEQEHNAEQAGKGKKLVRLFGEQRGFRDENDNETSDGGGHEPHCLHDRFHRDGGLSEGKFEACDGEEDFSRRDDHILWYLPENGDLVAGHFWDDVSCDSVVNFKDSHCEEGAVLVKLEGHLECKCSGVGGRVCIAERDRAGPAGEWELRGAGEKRIVRKKKVLKKTNKLY